MRIRDRSFIIVFSQGLTKATQVVLSIILVRMVSREVFGTYQEVLLVYTTLAGVLSLSLDSSLYYFIPKMGEAGRRMLLTQTLAGTITLAAVIGIVMFFGAPLIAERMNNPVLAELLRIFCLFPLVDRIVVLVPSFMISLDRSYRAGIFILVAALGRLGTVVVLFAMGYELPTVMWWMVIVASIVAALGLVDMFRLCPRGERLIDYDVIRAQLGYAWPLWATAVVGVLNMHIGKLLITTFFDPAMYGVYSVGAFEVPVVALITTSITYAIMPNLVRFVDEGRVSEAIGIWHEAARKCAFVIFPSFVLLFAIAPDLIVLLFTDEFSLAKWPFMIYLLCLPLRVSVYSAVFRALGQNRPIAVASSIALVTNAVVSLLLMIAGGGSLLTFVGPSIGMVVSVLLSTAYLLRRLCRITQTQFSRVMRWGELGRIFFLSVIAGGLLVIPLPISNLLVLLCVRAFGYAAAVIVMMFLTKTLKQDEIDILNAPVRLMKRLGHAGRKQ